MATKRADPPPLQTGDVVGGRYEIVRKLGEGGMGSVFEARNTSTGRLVALKVISEDLLAVRSARARFEREARAAGAIDSEYVVQMIDVGVDEGREAPFFAMELLAGKDVAAAVAEKGPLAPETVVKIGVQACLGLERAHAAGILHRDLKPPNLFLAERDGGELRVKIVDFGIAKIVAQGAGDTPAKLTRTGQLLGSPLYMSPEQVYGRKDVDHRTDIWSLGVVLYEALVGHAPFQDIDTVPELLMAIGTRPVPPIRGIAPWVPEDIAAAIERAIVIDREGRYADCAAMGAALQSLAPSGWSFFARDLARPPPPAGSVTAFSASSSSTATPDREVDVSPNAHGVAQVVTRQLPRKQAPPALTSTTPAARYEPTDRVSATLAAPNQGALSPPIASKPVEQIPPAASLGTKAPLVATIGAPPLPEPARRRSMKPIVAGVVALAAVAAGAVALRSTSSAPESAHAVPSARETASAPTTSVAPPTRPASATLAAPTSVGIPPSPLLDPLLGTWRSSAGNDLSAVRTSEGVEFRVVTAAQFGAADYQAGERRFLVTERDGALVVIDYLRPPAPAGAKHTEASRKACLARLDNVAGSPLGATLAGATLTVDLVELRWPDDARFFQRSGADVLGCPGLNEATRRGIKSTLTRRAP